MRELLLDHARRYPFMDAADFGKLVYQSAFAGGHLIASPEYALNRLKAEWSETPDASVPLIESVGNGLSRLYLAPARRMGLRPETVCGLFVVSAEGFRKDVSLFEAGMDELEALCAEGALSVSGDEIHALRLSCREAGYPPFSHSPRYRAAYAPAYRIVSDRLLAFLDVFAAVDALLDRQGRARVAIDGCCAAGKSTLGAMLAAVCDAQLFHMDDFFLPFERKTPERLAEAGGNVDRERFQSDIADHLDEARFSYRPYLCHEGALGEPIETERRPVQIVEGSYSLHPFIRAGYDLRVFLGLNAAEQSRRILARNGEAMHRRFMNEWVPMENRYFSAFSVQSLCDIIYLN